MITIRHLPLILISVLSLGVRAQTCAAVFDSENIVKIEKNQIVVNGEIQPNLYGAEFQYFRLRGGYGKNVPREKVIEIWKRGLDQMVKAGMNTISFYIPWDFHEYAPGKFDFAGKIDQDGDGKPDYPSRDILTFLKLVQERGIKKILIRPGPYINAEWGFLGFGAVPEWFHDQYPESHMQNSQGLKTKLYDYHNEDFLRHTKLWFEELNRQVLVHVIGKNKPGIFLQLDNETNFQWQSIYNHDYGPAATARYQLFLKNHYRSLAALNLAQKTSFRSWRDVAAPKVQGQNLQQDQDWYRFQDRSIFDYIRKVKKIWNEVGVREPNVIFTLAESFNAAKNGLLPNYKYRNNKQTGLMTINVYPKTWPAPEDVLLHQPHKSDYDIIAASSANQHYFGKKQEAVIGPEIDTGWFGNTVLTEEARQQTYLTLIGRGLKAMYFYYFNEGDNWQVEWGKNKIQPYFEALHSDSRFSTIKKEELPDLFWNELQDKIDREVMVGWNAKGVMFEDVIASQKLSFGAPLDSEAQPTKHFQLIAEIGQKIMKPYGEYLSQTVSLVDKVAMIADSGSLIPSSIPGIDSRELNSDFAGGLVGYILQSGINPSIHHWGINSLRNLSQNKIIFVQDSGNLNPELVQWLGKYIANGGTVVSFVGDSLAKEIGAPTATKVTSQVGTVPVTYKSTSQQKTIGTFDALAGSVSEYSLQNHTQTQPILVSGDKVLGYRYQYQKGSLVQIGAIIHDAFNSDAYAFLKDVPQRRAILDDLIRENHIQSQFRIAEGGDRLDVFGRKASNDEKLWITVKSGQLQNTKFHVQINQGLLSNGKSYQVKNILTGTTQKLDAETLISRGFAVDLIASGSAAYLVSPL
jgi:hypothetical protein